MGVNWDTRCSLKVAKPGEAFGGKNVVLQGSSHPSKCLLVIPPGRQQPAPEGFLDCTIHWVHLPLPFQGRTTDTSPDTFAYIREYGFHSHTAIPVIPLPANTTATLKCKGLTFQFRKVCASAGIRIVTF